MKKILYCMIWVCCIVLLAFAYDDFLYSQFKVEAAEGIVEDKGIGVSIRNIYGNFTEEREYWIQLNGEKMAVNRAVYEGAEQHRKIKIMITDHGMAIK
jgi:cytidine deaminase